MEAKKNLNNVQRKMLDEIYGEQFNKREALIRQERAEGLAKLKNQLLKDLVRENKDVKKMLDAGKVFYELSRELAAELRESNLSVTYSMSQEPTLEFNRYNYSGEEFQEIKDYVAETRRIELSLSEKRREMRARIYGLEASYADVDKEIKELLKEV